MVTTRSTVRQSCRTAVPTPPAAMWTSTRSPGRIGVETLSRHDLGEVEAAGARPHADLARRRLGIRPFADLQDFGPAVLGDPDRSHVASLLVAAAAAGDRRFAMLYLDAFLRAQ